MALETDIPDTIARTIDVLTAKLAAPAGQLMAEITRYVWARGISDLLITGVLLILVIGSWVLLPTLLRRIPELPSSESRTEAASDRRVFRTFVTVSTVLLGVLLITVAAAWARSAIPQILSPSGAALVGLLSGRGL